MSQALTPPTPPGFQSPGQQIQNAIAPSLNQQIGQAQTKITVSPDGGVVISFPKSSSNASNDRNKGKFYENLANRDDLDLAGIAAELLDGVEMDLKSRSLFLQNYQAGLDLLGLEMKEDRERKTSQVGHPLLLEAVVRAQSTAGAELMPASGPCKVQTAAGDDASTDAMAAAFENDMNTYLTSVAPEYYPDTDRGLFNLFYSGNMFKKVYYHPLKKRPVSETVGIEDLIVSEDATDLETAIRVTHRSEMTNTQIRRMQRFADWKDVDLGTAQPRMDSLKQMQDAIAGISNMMVRPKDVPHEILEVTADLDLADYGYDQPNLPDLPLSYVVTLDKQSSKVLAIRRGWTDGDEQFKRRQRFVHYGMVPSFNFLCLGFVHLLGNQTKALRGIWRLLVTSGLYANAPGGLKVKGVRTGQSDINPGPGEWPDIDIGSFDDIRKALMPMPYKDVSPSFMQLAEAINQDAMRMAGMVETEVGEGRTNVPVGTMMSMIEISTQTMSAVHKRLHRAQARELQLIKDCFAENPEALNSLPKTSYAWSKAEEFANLNLIPASDPNVPSQVHRIQLATAMVTVATQNPDLYDRTAVHKRAWKTIGVNDADSFVLPEPAPAPPGGPPGPPPVDPQIGQAKIMEAQAKMAALQQQGVDMQRKAAEAQLEQQARQQELAAEQQSQQAEMQSKERIAAQQNRIEDTRLQIEQARLAAEHQRNQQAHQLDQQNHQLAQHKAQLDHQAKMHQANIGFAGQLHSVNTQAESQANAANLSHETAKLTTQSAERQAQLGASTQEKLAKMKPKPSQTTSSTASKTTSQSTKKP